MDPALAKGPRYLLPSIPLEERVALFNRRDHPDRMTPQQRGIEMAALGKAPVPLIIFQLRLAELAGPGSTHLDIAAGFGEMVLDAVKEPGLVDGQPLRQITVEECKPAPMPPPGKLRLFED